ncbi:MAG: TldD/PmbA family protein [Promethearchaeota archaeon]
MKTIGDLEDLYDHATAAGLDFIEIHASEWESFSVNIRGKKTRELNSSIGSGLSVRVLLDGAFGFAATSSIDKDRWFKCCDDAIQLARNCQRFVRDGDKFLIDEDMKFSSGIFVISTRDELEIFSKEDKIQLLLDLDKDIRAYSPLIKNVIINYSETWGRSLLLNSLGARVEKEASTIFAIFNVLAQKDGVIQSGSQITSHIGSWRSFESRHLEEAIKNSADQGIRLLDAKPCPAGVFSIVCDNILGGVFVHEAMGHACEADAVLSGKSILVGKIDQEIGNEYVTIVDDGSNKDMFGHIPVDSEGIASGKTLLVDHGVLVSYLHDLETASRMDVEPTGNGRAQGYASIPQVRMTNTYLEPGDWKKDEIISETKDGLYCKDWQYGYVESEKGYFMFKCKEAYSIKDGEIKDILRDVALSGNILKVLHDIDAIASDFGCSAGYCGKSGQYVRVGDGSPHFRISNIIVGGM